MLRTSLEPPIEKSGGKVKNPAGEIILAKSALVLHNPKDFGSSDGMLDLDTCPGYFCVGRLLLPGKFLSLRLLCRLYHGDVIGPHGARLAPSMMPGTEDDVSIHAPAWSATY